MSELFARPLPKLLAVVAFQVLILLSVLGFREYTLLTNSAFFIIGGVLLLAVAFGLERLRRTLVARMDEEASSGDTRVRAPALHSGAP